MRWNPHNYQIHGRDHIISNPKAGLLLDMGLGKTCTTLTAIDYLMNEVFDVSKVLIIAPKKVAEETWSSEIGKWDHLKHLKLSKVLGTERQRKEALKVKADIYIIGRDNIVWLVAQFASAFPFGMVIVDESSSFKSPKSARFKALRKVIPLVSRVVLLTGTPTPNSLLDLWPQIYLLDQGERLGHTLTEFRGRFFRKDPYKPFGKYEVLKENEDDLVGEGYYEKKIYNKISDICISMKAEDYLDLPKRIDQITRVHLPDSVMQAYLDFEKSMVLQLLDEETISAVNAAALTTKLLQFAGGAVYREDKTYYEVHEEKLDALEERIEAANGKPVLIAYNYRHELERIMRRLKSYKPVEFTSAGLVKPWNEGKIPVLLGHPQSMAHGLNMQDGGHLVEWYSNTWSSESYLQLIARLDRQGQKYPVINNRNVAVGTIDEDVIASQESKLVAQNALMRAVKARIDKYRR